MEKAAVALVNQVSKTPWRKEDQSELKLNAEQVEELLQKISLRLPSSGGEVKVPVQDLAAGMMDSRLVSVLKTATVAEAISQIRRSAANNNVDHIFVVDERGRYFGCVLTLHLLTTSEQATVESLADTKPLYVRTDTHRSELKKRFAECHLTSVPVLDHEDRLVGHIARDRNGDGA
jgi:magnesium transporter